MTSSAASGRFKRVCTSCGKRLTMTRNGICVICRSSEPRPYPPMGRVGDA